MTLQSVEPVELSEIFGGVPLTVVFADTEALAALREGDVHRVALEPPFHVSDEDVYLVLPSDIGLELVDIFADGDDELLTEAIDEGLLVLGSIEREGRGKVLLEVEESIGLRALLEGALPYSVRVPVGGTTDPVELLNSMEQSQVTISSELVDEEGLESMLANETHIGASWRVPANADHLAGVDPTYVFSRRLQDGSVGIEAALFAEYEELVMVLRPAVLVAEAPSHASV